MQLKKSHSTVDIAAAKIAGTPLATILTDAKVAALKRRVLGPYLKGVARAREKVTIDYHKDWSRMKDLLRATILVGGLNELNLAHAALADLAKSGVITVLELKNRFFTKESAAAGGYR